MHDKRRFPRKPRVESLSLTVVNATHLIEQGERFYAETVDMSPAGLQVVLDRFLEKDSRIEIWLVLLSTRRTLHLQGRISWLEVREEDGQDRYHAGVQLLPAKDSDFDTWLALFDQD
jgi:hypothetical protein